MKLTDRLDGGDSMAMKRSPFVGQPRRDIMAPVRATGASDGSPSGNADDHEPRAWAPP